MTNPPTPLPELDEILEHLLIDYDFDVKDKDSRTFDRAKQAIRTLVLEEIIGQDESTKSIGDTPLKFREAHRNALRAEQRKKLGEL